MRQRRGKRLPSYDELVAAAEKVSALGGTARPAFDIGDQGRMAVCFDPNGAEFDVASGALLDAGDYGATSPVVSGATPNQNAGDERENERHGDDGNKRATNESKHSSKSRWTLRLVGSGDIAICFGASLHFGAPPD